MYWMPISSLMVISRWLRTSNVTGSIERGWGGVNTVRNLSMARGDTSVAEIVDARLVAGVQHDGRPGMLDNSRPRDAGAGLQGGAFIDRRIDHALDDRAEGLSANSRFCAV